MKDKSYRQDSTGAASANVAPGPERRLDFVGGMRKVQETPQGGILAPAYLTRTGVFVYHRQDGSTVRELRHPDDVFSKDSLATLRGAPVTIGHPSESVRADNWRSLAVGDIDGKVKIVDGKYVSAKTRIQDAATVAAVKRGDLVELSCGYETDVVDEKGVYNGEEYDCRQTNIRYNHVALGPKDWGRAGGEVSLKLDCLYTEDMKHSVRRSDNAVAPAAAPPANTATVSQADYDRVCGELEAVKAQLAAAQANVPTADSLDAMVSTRVALVDAGRAVIGKDFTAKRADGKSKTDREIMVEVCSASVKTFKSDGKSDDYVRGVFESVTAGVKAGEAAVATLNAATVPVVAPARTDAAEPEDRLEAAKKRSDERGLKAGKSVK